MTELEAETFLIEEHWKKIGIQNGWTLQDFNRLAAKMSLSPVRLALLVGLKKHEYVKIQRKGQTSRVVALHCVMIESFIDAGTQALMPFDILS